MARLKLVCAIAVLCIVVIAPVASEAATNCTALKSDFVQCFSFIQLGSNPTERCCDGVRALSNGTTTSDRQSSCQCITKSLKNVKVNESIVAALPGKCNVIVPYNFSSSNNCTAVI